MLVSIIVPVYKVEEYLYECLESLVNQSYKEIEIILIDDGSPDTCPQICDSYAEKYTFIKVIHKENGGLSSAWMCGMENMSESSRYVTFVDSDDWIPKDYIEQYVKAANKYHTDIVIGNMVKFRPDKQIVSQQNMAGLFDRDRLEKELYPILLNNGKFHGRAIPISRWGKLYKKELILPNIKYCSPKTSYSEDLNLVFPLLLDAQSIYFLKTGEGIYYYRLNPLSMLHSYDKNMLYSINHVYPALKQICIDKNHPELEKQVNADYLAASVQYFKNELQNPAGLAMTKKNIRDFIQNDDLRKVINEVDWSKYQKLNVMIIKTMENYNWFCRNIITSLLRFLKRCGIRKIT